MEQGGLVRLEIIRDAQGNLEDAYVKVCILCDWLTFATHF